LAASSVRSGAGARRCHVDWVRTHARHFFAKPPDGATSVWSSQWQVANNTDLEGRMNFLLACRPARHWPLGCVGALLPKVLVPPSKWLRQGVNAVRDATQQQELWPNMDGQAVLTAALIRKPRAYVTRQTGQSRNDKNNPCNGRECALLFGVDKMVLMVVHSVSRAKPCLVRPKNKSQSPLQVLEGTWARQC